MWNLLKKHEEDCMKLQDLLEESAAACPEAVRVEELNAAWPAAQRAHIPARERELSEVASTWLAVPKFASRLAVASGALLLVASTWLYERPLPAPNQQAGTLAAQESLFESPAPA